MSDNPNSHAAQATGEGILDFLDYAINKGYLKVPTGQAMKTACREVLQATEGDDWGSAQLDEIDIDDTLRRFETLRAMKFSSGSLSTYKARFKKSLLMFADFRSNPGGWKPDMKQRTRRGTKPTVEPDPGSGSDVETMRTPSPPVSPNVITYPFPLREGVLVSIQLPADITKREAKRLAAFIDSLALEEQAALNAGSTT